MDCVEFRWNRWNIDHIGKHGITPDEAEHVVRFARKYRRHRQGSWICYGRGNNNRKIEAVYVKDADGTLYIIHAMPFK
jgi:hypothetical protein